MKTRIVALILALALVVTVLSGCNITIGSAASVPSGTDADGRFVYTVIRPETSAAVVETGAKHIRTAMKDNFDCKVNIVKDNVVEAVEGTCEILVGNTNRPESAEALKIVTENRSNNAFDFIVKVINNKICIQATTDNMVEFACDWFVETYCGSLEDWSLLKEDYTFLYVDDTPTVENTVAGVNIGRFTVVKPLTMSYLIGYQAERILEYYKNNGLTMEYIDDIDPETTYEILIGDTSREASKSVTVEGDNFVIKVVGTKLVIKGGNDLATYKAVNYFIELIEKAGTSDPFSWTDGYVINGKYDATEEGTYTLNFADEFEGSTLDLSVWGDYNYESSRTRKSSLGGTLWYSSPKNESTAYGKPLPHKNVYVSDGNLVLSTYKLNDTDFVGTYASTYYAMLFKYGVWEIRAKQSLRPGCMSYWLNGTGEGNLESRYGSLRRAGFTEIDLIETYGSQTKFGSAIHRWFNDMASDGITGQSGHTTIGGVSRYYNDENNANYTLDVDRYGGDLTEGYHIFSCYWSDDGFKFAFDGRSYLTYDFAWENSVSIHAMLNYINFHFRMGDASYGTTYKKGVDPDYVESYMDWVRIYQTDAMNSQMVKSYSEYVEPKETIVMYPENPIRASY